MYMPPTLVCIPNRLAAALTLPSAGAFVGSAAVTVPE